MKRLVIVGLAVVAGGLGYYRVSRENRTDRADTTYLSHSPVPPTSTLTDPAEVFQKAFWKRPTADDRVLHAERREWTDASGVQRWQWFIAVEPSAALVKHLREDNAFSLASASTAPGIQDAPEWFDLLPEEVDILRAPGGGMCLIFSKTRNLLLATDSGGGFRPGAPAPPEAAPPAGQFASGRLPKTPPPAPPKP